LGRLMEPWHQDDRATIYHGDCVEVLRQLPDASVDAVVTDPPYGLGFMGKEWDGPGGMLGQMATGHEKRGALAYGGSHSRGYADNDSRHFQAWAELWAAECLRVLKPGGHILAFGGTRTWHRLACAIEDAGFEVRDSIAWMYGSGFPKSLDVSKAIDKAAGAERPVTGPRTYADGTVGHFSGAAVYGAVNEGSSKSITAPVTDAAREWSGWGTALKPAHEPIVVARKPLVGTVAANVLQHGTGALNIDACRIDMGAEYDPTKVQRQQNSGGAIEGAFGAAALIGKEIPTYKPGGRWPANVVLDESQAAELDRQSGNRKSSGIYAGDGVERSSKEWATDFGGTSRPATMYADSGGASRFFYVAKAPARERPKVDGTAHPTVKPLTLMRWLCRLVTPPNGVILEPFSGSGTTVEAALLEGFRVVAIEREADYLPLIQARLDRVAAQEPEDEQLTLDASA